MNAVLIGLQMIESEDGRTLFEQLYLEYRQLMFYVARNILYNDQDAEDAVHQAFLSIMENLQKISKVRCPKTKAFCVIIVKRKAIDLLRARKHIACEALEDGACGVDIPLPGDHGLADAMAKIPNRYQEALLLHFYFGYTTREMEKHLGLTRSAVLKLIWRAKEALRRQLEEDGKTNEK